MKSYKDIAGDGGSDIVGQVTEQAQRLEARLASVRHVVAVMSGKGGVGKSSVTVNLAATLAHDGGKIGILDADINGPSIAKMTGVQGQPLRQGQSGVLPADAFHGIKVMSMDLFLPDAAAPVLWDAPTQRDAFTWRGMMEMGALRDFITDTEWGELDVLLIDLPPGTDKLPNIVDLLPRLSGTIIVTIPSGISGFIIGKSIEMARQVLQTPVAGLVENMASFVCAHCGQEETLFPGDEVAQLARQYDLPVLGKIAFDPRLALAADEGRSFVATFPDTAAAQALQRIAAELKSYLKI